MATTSLVSQTPTTPKYAYEGKGWQDPLAQEIAKKYLYSPFMAKNYSKSYPDAGNKSFNRYLASAKWNQERLDEGKMTGYNSPLDPKNWVAGGVWQQRGGKPINDYQTNPYHFDADLARQEYIDRGGLGLPKEMYPEKYQAQIKADKLAAQGSSHSLSPEVMNKMWR